jgi:hypothetical protein
MKIIKKLQKKLDLYFYFVGVDIFVISTMFIATIIFILVTLLCRFLSSSLF